MTVEPGPITREELERRNGCALTLLACAAFWLALGLIVWALIHYGIPWL